MICMDLLLYGHLWSLCIVRMLFLFPFLRYLYEVAIKSL